MPSTVIDVVSTRDAGDRASAPADWSTQFVQFLVRAAARSERTLELSGRILVRASRGELSPAALQDALADSARTAGRAYADETAAAHARFLTRLVQAGAGGSRPAAPPAFDASDPVAGFQRIAEYAWQMNASAVDMYQSGIERAAAGEAVAASAFEGDRLPEHLGHVARLCFDLLNELTDLRARHEEDCLRRVLAAADGWDAAAPFALTLIAPSGEVASASLSLANTRRDCTVVRCVVPGVRRADGVGPAFAPQVALTPDEVSIEPGHEMAVRLALRLDAGTYEPDVPYVGALCVTRHGEARLDIPLRIVASSRAGRSELHRGAP